MVGAAGLILTQIMCKAMNRSVLPQRVASASMGGDEAVAEDARDYTSIKSSCDPEEICDELAPLLEAASSVIFVPGYGLAVAQAQHKWFVSLPILLRNSATCEVSLRVSTRSPAACLGT